MSQTQRNEGKCCDAVLRVLEHRLNTQRADLHVPDRADRTEKRVDLCARLGANRYVLEHTRIDPFEEAVTISEDFSDFVTPIEERLSGVLPGPALHIPFTAPGPAVRPWRARHWETHRQGPGCCCGVGF